MRTRWATATGGKPIDGEDALPALLSGELHAREFGGGGEETGLVCGYLACDGELIKPVLAGLPRVVRVNIRTDASGEWLENTLRHAVDAGRAATPGSDVILAHLAEVLFTEVLRRYLTRAARGRTGWLAGRGRSGRGTRLAALHGDPRRLDARRAGARSGHLAFGADRALHALHRPERPWPISRTGAWSSAAEALRTTSRSVQRVALESATSPRRRSIARSSGASPCRRRGTGASPGERGGQDSAAPERKLAASA